MSWLGLKGVYGRGMQLLSENKPTEENMATC
jgi:hypothetical protein